MLQALHVTLLVLRRSGEDVGCWSDLCCPNSSRQSSDLGSRGLGEPGEPGGIGGPGETGEPEGIGETGWSGGS